MDKTEPPGLIDETRDALVRAAFELIERDGFASTTAAAIADEAGFTERTFFRYFHAKEDVVFAPMESAFDDHVSYIRDHISTQGLTVDSLVDALFEANVRDPSRFAVTLRSVQAARDNPELERRLAYHQQWVADRITETVVDLLGQDRPDLPVRVTVAVAVAIMAVAASQWADSDREAPIHDILADVRRAARDGLSGTPVPARAADPPGMSGPV